MSNLIKIHSYYHEDRIYTPEEYIKYKIIEGPNHVKYVRRFTKNVGITKSQLKDLAINKYGIKDIKSTATKEMILDKILIYEDVYELANMLKIGVKWFQYAETFGLSMNQVVKFELVGFLKTIDHDINNYLQPEGIYDIKQFSLMTNEDINDAIEKYKIYKEKEDMCIDIVNSTFEYNKEMYKYMNYVDDKCKDIEEFADDPEGFMKRHNIKWD